MPVLFRWLQNISLIKYAFEGLCVNEVSPTYCAGGLVAYTMSYNGHTVIGLLLTRIVLYVLAVHRARVRFRRRLRGKYLGHFHMNKRDAAHKGMTYTSDGRT